jgi:hypothetical protein
MAESTDAEPIIPPTIDRKVEEFADDLGRLLGKARAKADSWLSQRQALVDHLTELRDTATHLLRQFEVGAAVAQRRQSPGIHRRGPRRQPKAAATIDAAPRKRRTLSAEAREKIAAAQRARWAKQKARTVQSGDQPAVKRGRGRPRKAQTGGASRKPRTMSAEARERIAAAQRARWAKQKAGEK